MTFSSLLVSDEGAGKDIPGTLLSRMLLISQEATGPPNVKEEFKEDVKQIGGICGSFYFSVMKLK